MHGVQRGRRWEGERGSSVLGTHGRGWETESGERSKRGLPKGHGTNSRRANLGDGDGADWGRDEITHAASGITTL